MIKCQRKNYARRRTLDVRRTDAERVERSAFGVWRKNYVDKHVSVTFYVEILSVFDSLRTDGPVINESDIYAVTLTFIYTLPYNCLVSPWTYCGVHFQGGVNLKCKTYI